MKMNLSMDFLKPISGVLKKYTALVPSVIITTVALLLLLPTVLVGGKVKDKMEESVKTARNVKSMLQDVPSRELPEELQKDMDELEKEKIKIQELAIQGSQRDLVMYDYVIFPIPVDQSTQIYLEYGKKYRQAIENLMEKMNALDAPSEREIGAETGGGPKVTAMYGGSAEVDVQDPTINALCQARAQEISVYTNPSAFKWYEFWKDYKVTGKNQALEDCWDSQVAFWIYEDIVETIKKINGDNIDVQTLPVKRLLGVSFTAPIAAGSGSRSDIYRGQRDIPNYIAPMKMSNFIGVSPTGREGNDEVDIIHFAVALIIENNSILPFMKELCSEKPHTFHPEFKSENQIQTSRHNLITILQSDLQVIDKDSKDHKLYRYGKAAVARLDLVCEYQFDRSGYDIIKPDPVKERLGQPVEGQEQDQPAAGMMPGMF